MTRSACFSTDFLAGGERNKSSSSSLVSVEFTDRTEMSFFRSSWKHCDFGVRRRDDKTAITSQHLRLSSDSLAATSGTEM